MQNSSFFCILRWEVQIRRIRENEIPYFFYGMAIPYDAPAYRYNANAMDISFSENFPFYFFPVILSVNSES